MIKKVSILGSTGSIGKQTIDVIKKTKGYQIIGLSCNKDIKTLYKQIIDLNVKEVAVFDKNAAISLVEKLNKNNLKVKVYTGIDGLIKIATLNNIDTVVVAVVGMIGIKPTIEAIRHKKTICLANKETLVCAGDIIMPMIKKYNVDLRPIDSEHSAIWQSLVGEKHDSIKNIILTASGGPFYKKKTKELENVKIEECLKHPNWKMGKKITIDSSTLVNKGLEVIEAHYLFNVSYDKIKVIVQRESIIHSMVEFNDGAIKAELGVPSMRIPISYALYKENRPNIHEKNLDFKNIDKISIGLPDLKVFIGLKLAYEVLKIGGLMPCLYNALNEVAVNYYINKHKNNNGKVFNYLDITRFIKKGIKEFKNKKLNKNNYSIEDIDMVLEFANKLSF